MPLVRMTVSVGCEDLPSRPGETVQLPAERAQQVIRAGWGEYVRAPGAETPERRVPQPERAVEAPERAVTTDAPQATPETPEAAQPARRRRAATRKPKD